jgi:CDGSH-type Zn-finger protein
MAATKITIKTNGSIRVEGDFEIVDLQGNVYNINGRQAVSLCRCDLSKIRPFCDSAHKGCFVHEAVAFDYPLPAPKPAEGESKP